MKKKQPWLLAPGVVPDNVQDALATLWEYSSDAGGTLLSKKELRGRGYKCPTDLGWIYTFVFKDRAI